MTENFTISFYKELLNNDHYPYAEAILNKEIDSVYFLWYTPPPFFFNPFPYKPLFSRVCSASLLKTLWEKEKLLVTSNFSFSHSVFYCFGELSAIFIKFEIVFCKLFQFGRV